MTRATAHTLDVSQSFIFSYLIDDESMVPTGRTIIQFPQGKHSIKLFTGTEKNEMNDEKYNI